VCSVYRSVPLVLILTWGFKFKALRAKIFLSELLSCDAGCYVEHFFTTGFDQTFARLWAQAGPWRFLRGNNFGCRKPQAENITTRFSRKKWLLCSGAHSQKNSCFVFSGSCL